MHSECESYNYVHTKSSAPSDNNNIQYYCNDENILDYVIPRVHVDRALYSRTKFKPDSIRKIVEMSKQQSIYCDKLFQGQGKLFDINCYNIL